MAEPRSKPQSGGCRSPACAPIDSRLTGMIGIQTLLEGAHSASACILSFAATLPGCRQHCHLRVKEPETPRTVPGLRSPTEGGRGHGSRSAGLNPAGCVGSPAFVNTVCDPGLPSPANLSHM